MTEITRIRFRRTVNATNSLRPLVVCPKAKYLFSNLECPKSERSTNGSLKKMSSASSGVTRWYSQFLMTFASSQSKPVQAASGSFSPMVCIYHTYTYVSSAARRSTSRFNRFATNFGIFTAFWYAAVPAITNTGGTALELIPVAERMVSQNRESYLHRLSAILKVRSGGRYGIPRRFLISACQSHSA